MNLIRRFENNPVISPIDVLPSSPELKVECVLNPGAFEFNGRIGLLLRVCETLAEQKQDVVTALVADKNSENGIRKVEISKDDPLADFSDPRLVFYGDITYLTTISHLRLAWSDNGEVFKIDSTPSICGQGDLENFGIEDCRVTKIDETYYLTYSAVSASGVGVGLITTKDWQNYKPMGMILPPHNKDSTLFEEKIDGRFACLHRPVGVELGGPYIWYASSPDCVNWGSHKCVAKTRKGMWDSARVGAGAAPIKTDKGWLEIYHGADEKHRYGLGALLLDFELPWKVIARSEKPIMTPDEDYEKKGFFGNVVFTNGHVRKGDELLVYYGAGDSVVAGARMSINEILATL